MLDEIFDDAKRRMQKSIESLQTELGKLRTGRAHPSLLEHIKVDYFDQMTPLNQVANIAIESARTLTVTPWDKNMIAKIEKAIMVSDLGLNPNTAGMVIRVPLPPLTEERRKELVRIVRAEVEKGRVSVRNIRRELNSLLKNFEKEKKISKDEERQAQTKLQNLTDETIAQLDAMGTQKERDLMAI